MTKVYTRKGDLGTTILNRKEIDKDSCLTKTLGAYDSLMASIDRAMYGLDILPDMEFEHHYFLIIQNTLRDIITEISAGKQIIKTSKEHIRYLESVIDNVKVDICDFVRFKNPVAMDIDEARVRTRKFERELTGELREDNIVKESYAFVNRLSDYFFVLAVFIDRKYE